MVACIYSKNSKLFKWYKNDPLNCWWKNNTNTNYFNFSLFFIEKKIDLSKVKNDNCNIKHANPISTTELHLSTRNVNKLFEESAPFIKIELGT